MPYHLILDEAADKEASEMLTGNAQNLMQAVSEVCVCACVRVCVCVCVRARVVCVGVPVIASYIRVYIIH